MISGFCNNVKLNYLIICDRIYITELLLLLNIYVYIIHLCKPKNNQCSCIVYKLMSLQNGKYLLILIIYKKKEKCSKLITIII